MKMNLHYFERESYVRFRYMRQAIEEQILTPIMIMVLWSKFHGSFFMPSQHSTQWLIAYLQYTSSSLILKLIVQYGVCKYTVLITYAGSLKN